MKERSKISSKKMFIMGLFVCIGLLGACANQNTEETVSKESSQMEESQASTEMSEPTEMTKKTLDLSSSFGDINGCAVFFNVNNNEQLYYNEEMSKTQASPFSTFKIISSLMGLENGILENENSKMSYNGTQYPRNEWNGDLTLKEAFQTSCVWYFRQVIDAVGETQVRNELENLQYGNRDVSEWAGNGLNPLADLSGFWIGSSLKISPDEQVRVLHDLFEGKTNYSKHSIDVLKQIMLVEDTGEQQIYGKTGSSLDGEAWFVGFTEKSGEKVYFAVYLNDYQQRAIPGNTAKEIAVEAVKSDQVW